MASLLRASYVDSFSCASALFSVQPNVSKQTFIFVYFIQLSGIVKSRMRFVRLKRK